jgi:hypothetical protein
LIISGYETDIDDEDLATLYRRPKLVDEPETDEVSDYVAIRLALIRAKTLHKYREIYYNKDI